LHGEVKHALLYFSQPGGAGDLPLQYSSSLTPSWHARQDAVFATQQTGVCVSQFLPSNPVSQPQV
jgi:hypothetical protein